MGNRASLCLLILSTLLFGGCVIAGRIVDQNGVGLAGVTVTLSGDLSRTTTTDANGDYSFGDLVEDDFICAGSYAVTPSLSTDSFTPTSRNVAVTSQPLESFGDVPCPVGGVDFIRVVSEESCGIVCLKRTDQKTCYNELGAVIDCTGTGQDGDNRAGVEWPEPRFEDNGDGTITDHLTGLIWLKNGNSIGGTGTWSQALTNCNNLASGTSGLADNSAAGDWRLPNRKELMSLIDYERYNPALPQDHPFINIQSSPYWSSTPYAYNPSFAWVVSIGEGDVSVDSKSFNYCYVLPVRSGQ